jgi:uncharacterized protein
MPKYAVITGASSGIGKEFAKLFASEGYHLVLVARRTEAMQELAGVLETRYGTKSDVIAMDLSVPGAGRDLHEKVSALPHGVDVLVNNAGFGLYGEFLELPLEKQEQMMRLNMETLTTLSYLFGNEFVKQGSGYIINLASVVGFAPGPLMALYFATKNYVVALSEALHEEWKHAGVGVTALCPGTTRTEFFDIAGVDEKSNVKKIGMAADKVALIGFLAMKAHKRVIIPGIMNWVAVQFISFMPHVFLLPALRIFTKMGMKSSPKA